MATGVIEVQPAEERNVTERKHVDELRDTILAAVSHELRTPLTSIVGFALTLKERTRDAAVRTSLLDTMVGQAQKLERMLAEPADYRRLFSSRSI